MCVVGRGGCGVCDVCMCKVAWSRARVVGCVKVDLAENSRKPSEPQDEGICDFFGTGEVNLRLWVDGRVGGHLPSLPLYHSHPPPLLLTS